MKFGLKTEGKASHEDTLNGMEAEHSKEKWMNNRTLQVMASDSMALM